MLHIGFQKQAKVNELEVLVRTYSKVIPDLCQAQNRPSHHSSFGKDQVL